MKTRVTIVSCCILFFGLAFWACGGASNRDGQAVKPGENVLAYINSDGVEIGTPEDVAALKGIEAAAGVEPGVVYFDRDSETGRYTLTRKKAPPEGPDISGISGGLGMGGGCPGGSCTARSPSGSSCSSSCAPGNSAYCSGGEPPMCGCTPCT